MQSHDICLTHLKLLLWIEKHLKRTSIRPNLLQMDYTMLTSRKCYYRANWASSSIYSLIRNIQQKVGVLLLATRSLFVVYQISKECCIHCWRSKPAENHTCQNFNPATAKTQHFPTDNEVVYWQIVSEFRLVHITMISLWLWPHEEIYLIIFSFWWWLHEPPFSKGLSKAL